MIWEPDLLELGAHSTQRLTGENRLTETGRLAHLGVWFDVASKLAELHWGDRRRFGRTTRDERKWYE